MSAKHTPGPWSAIYPEERVFYAGTDITSYDVVSEKTRLQLREEGRAHYDRVHEDVANVAIVSTHFWRDMSDEEAKANACLIASAPELLDALQWLVDLMPDPELDRDPVQREFVIKAKAVILKATGGKA